MFWMIDSAHRLLPLTHSLAIGDVTVDVPTYILNVGVDQNEL